jgi:isoquinoline 1-oxidoreductase alpha subunit
MSTITINDQSFEIDASDNVPLLWVIRDQVGLTGTKFGCGIAQCGACTVLLDGIPVRSCSYPASAVQANAKITTIEGLGDNAEAADTAIQKAWQEHQVPQCGYCQSGQIMAATALLTNKPNPSDEDINQAMSNICRCGTYPRIKAAIQDASKMMQAAGNTTENKTEVSA